MTDVPTYPTDLLVGAKDAIVCKDLGQDKGDSFEEGDREEAFYDRSPTPSEYPGIYIAFK